MQLKDVRVICCDDLLRRLLGPAGAGLEIVASEQDREQRTPRSFNLERLS